ncbi:MAG: DUF2905 domain-containing protein [Verrucomicrobiota bacterium]
MNEPGKILVAIGAILVAVGLLLWSGIGKNWLGRLPGDIHVDRGNFKFYFLIVTCLLLSLLLSVILKIFRR